MFTLYRLHCESCGFQLGDPCVHICGADPAETVPGDAVSGYDGGEGCEHVRDEACGYIEALPCDHVCDADCATPILTQTPDPNAGSEIPVPVTNVVVSFEGNLIT